MSEVDIIRSASSRWLREHEDLARHLLYLGASIPAIQAAFGWSDAQLNNMLTYLDLVGEP